MIDIKIDVEGPPVGPQLTTELERIKQRIQRSLANAASRLVDSTLSKGRADISGAGRFGARWTTGLTAAITGEGNVRTITYRHAVPYWRVFQYGAIITGKRGLLWIPLPGVSPNERGDFFQTSRKGNLLLFKKVGKGIIPLRVGKESVRIPKKFHLVEIVRAEAKTFGALYRVEMASA
jgi:hypothetical protein